MCLGTGRQSSLFLLFLLSSISSGGVAVWFVGNGLSLLSYSGAFLLFVVSSLERVFVVFC